MSNPSPSPLSALAAGFAEPEALRGEAGFRLAEWLREGGVPVEMVADAEKAFRAHGERFRGELGWVDLRSDLGTLIFARQYDAAPRFAELLRESLWHVDSEAQWQGLLQFLEWLARTLALGSARG